MILFDIDRFKVVNYGYGEQYGDALLTWLARLARTELRPADQLSRWGGQEFLCLLPGAEKITVENVADRLRRKIEADPAKPKLIATVWGGGYSFAADVKEIA